jgi:hypothetical protein
MQKSDSIKVGIGFATGRKTFQNVLKTNIHSWQEYGLVGGKEISLNLFVAYDLDYNQTKSTDYTQVSPDLIEEIDSSTFVSDDAIKKEIDYLIRENVINSKEAHIIFGKGLAAKRNSVIYSAIKQKIDYLIFLDDDDYPMAVTNTLNTTIWGGQHVLATHLKYIAKADVTIGHHCGYNARIPYVEFNEILTEIDFRSFVEAISNDNINWDEVKTVMANGGVTYADTNILTSDEAFELPEINHRKLISGSNLCLNLTDPRRVFPFYNPPGARGEDTFLSTLLNERKVLKVPCYTFRDGFSTYNHLLEGVLPVRLKFAKADNEKIITRFYNACMGWIGYKPLLLYITQQDLFEGKIAKMREQLKKEIPKICEYFGNDDFGNILNEFEEYTKNVEKHYAEFLETQRIWAKIMEHFANTDC